MAGLVPAIHVLDCNESVPMFVDSSNKVVCYTDVQNAVGCARQNINIAA